MATSDSTSIQIPLAIDGATVELPLSKGHKTIIDAVDADLMCFKWCVRPSHDGLGTLYARRRWGNPVEAAPHPELHRVILSRMLNRRLTTKEQVDHIDGDGLNNCRSNLRLATVSQNNRNRPTRRDSKTGLKGVHFDKQRGKWYARISTDKKHRFLGRFDTPEEAHEAYCKAAEQLHKEFARYQ